ncbi:hypothetical protein LUZ60_006755 [Juncus effusus]|nr:hypothetical protein LUZ60_006755 [Juncus effusus]
MASLPLPPFLKKYWLPLILFGVGLFFQLVVLPSSYPPSHYHVLELGKYASVEEVEEAYERLSQEWLTESGRPTTAEFIEIRYAYELLSEPTWKKNYDIFGLDEQQHIFQAIKEQYQLEEDYTMIKLPLLNTSLLDSTIDAFNILTQDMISDREKPLLVQVYSNGSPKCAQFIDSWKRIDSLLDGVAETGMIEINDVKLAAYHAEKKFGTQPFFRNGLPAFIAYPASCRSSDCYMRYNGQLSVDSIVDWMATFVLGLPRILYFTKDSLIPKFIGTVGYHKVKIICFSKTGERAAPFLRQLALQYLDYANFGFVLYKEEDSQFWWHSLGVESAPAFVFYKNAGIKPIVHHGISSRTELIKLIEADKHQELPQLKSDTSLQLGCDPKGNSLAGFETLIWYCVIVVGRPSIELTKMREVIRKTRDELSTDQMEKKIDSAASVAFKENRLSFAWLDGEVQKKLCVFYLNSDASSEGTCGPRVYGDPDWPRVFIIRFQKKTKDELAVEEKNKNNLIQSLRGQNGNYASQLVAVYNGSADADADSSTEIIQWISKIIKDGDTREIPFFTQNAPDLVPEETKRTHSSGTHSVANSLKLRVKTVISHMRDYTNDPRIGPTFLLFACISFGLIWLKNASPSPATNQQGKTRRRRDDVAASGSITDEIPKDAYNMISSGSDTE